MKVARWVCLSFAGLMLLTGCSGLMTVPPSGVTPASLFTDVKYPSRREPETRFNFSKNDIDILGPVHATAESQTILSLLSQGDNGYGNLLKAARKEYPNADGVINVQWDTQFNNVCMGFLYQKATSHMDGTAIRFKR